MHVSSIIQLLFQIEKKEATALIYPYRVRNSLFDNRDVSTLHTTTSSNYKCLAILTQVSSQKELWDRWIFTW